MMSSDAGTRETCPLPSLPETRFMRPATRSCVPRRPMLATAMRPRAITLAMSIVAMVLLAPGARAQGAPPAAMASRDSVAPAAALPSVALPAELDRVLRDYEKLWRSGDAAALAELFTHDGFVLQGGRPPVRGREAIRRAYTGAAGGELSLRALAWSADGGTAFIIGAYTYGDAVGDVGKFTLTLRRPAGGRWLIFSDMDNSSRPMRRNP